MKNQIFCYSALVCLLMFSIACIANAADESFGDPLREGEVAKIRIGNGKTNPRIGMSVTRARITCISTAKRIETSGHRMNPTFSIRKRMLRCLMSKPTSFPNGTPIPV